MSGTDVFNEDFVGEGSPYSLTLGPINDPGMDSVTSYKINWGDSFFDVFAGSPTGQVKTHTYADGPNDYTITVDLTDEDGTFTGAGSKAVTVNNVAPTVALSGDASVNEGSVYSLNLGAITDPGTETVIGYKINWGDSFFDVFAGIPSGVKTHTYADGPNDYTITVDLTDEDGTFTGAGSKAVTVNNVAPTIALNGDASVDEDAVYSLTLGAITDPGTDTVSGYKINWGDSFFDVFAGIPSGVKTHTYADGPNDYTITVDLTDEDGEFSDTATVEINVVDKTAPTVSASQDPSPNANGWNSTLVTVTLTATDNSGVKEIHYSIDGIPSPIVPGSTTSFALPEGSHTISYYAVDNAGNSGTPGTMTVNIDMTLPVVAITTPADGDYYKSSALPPTGVYTVTDANFYTVAEEGYSTAEGPQTYKVTATDIAGNVGSASVNYTVDNTAPTVTINAPANEETYLSTSVPALDYTINDIDPNPAITVDGYSADLGTHTVTVTATDAALNMGSASSTYTVVPPDSDAPAVSASQAPQPSDNGWNNSDVTVTLTATDNAGGSGVKEIHWSDSFDGFPPFFQVPLLHLHYRRRGHIIFPIMQWIMMAIAVAEIPGQ